MRAYEKLLIYRQKLPLFYITFDLHKLQKLTQTQDQTHILLFIIVCWFELYFLSSSERERERERERDMERMSTCLCLAFLLFSFVADAMYIPRRSHHLLSWRQNRKTSKSNTELPSHFATRYFPQNLDHFSFQPESYQVFHQKYLINSHFWRKGGPIFVYTGNEGDIEWFASNTGFMLDIAPKFQALLVFIEVKALPKSHYACLV